MEDGDSHIEVHNTTKTVTTERIYSVVFVFLFCALPFSCSKKSSDALQGSKDSIDYVVFTRDVETLISDSGVTRYKLLAAEWYIYAQPEAKWYFPRGIHLEQFDTLFHTEASVRADSAYYYQDRRLWELIGNIQILNRAGERFYTSRLFWSQDEGSIYSHEASEIHLGTGRIIRPRHGFKSNQDMSKWDLFDTDAEMPVTDDLSTPADTTQTQASAEGSSIDSLPSSMRGKKTPLEVNNSLEKKKNNDYSSNSRQKQKVSLTDSLNRTARPKTIKTPPSHI